MAAMAFVIWVPRDWVKTLYSLERFNNDITKVPWSVLETFDDPDDKLHAFNLLFNEVLDRHAPLKTIRLRGRPNPYITDEIRDLMTTRDG